MAADAVKTTPLSHDTEQVLRELDGARRGTLALVGHLSEEDLERVHSPIMSPLVWDLGHIAAYEDLWLCHRHGGRALLRPELAGLYDAFETPRAIRGEIEALGPEDARGYLEQVRARTIETLADCGVGDGLVCEMVLRHELQHGETMRQTMVIAGLLEPSLHPLPGREGWIDLPGGPAAVGAGLGGFSYDNERPRHTIEVPGFRIARRPVTNGSWMRFSDGGGYRRREWWSDEGWAWKQRHDITHHPAIATAHPEAAVCHVSWFEADAFARAHDARLPTEFEWEKAASAGLEDLEGPRPAGAALGPVHSGVLADVGGVWEWTGSHFRGYPGFIAHPYREYSEVFFGDRYRVLRGSSWATDPRVASVTFRNWDLPERRQIFSGVRLARGA
ncbi:MAG TPA: SUMF1/EgtB/PvdO family nonheme iron enzyme [Solirubrobacteraceae bacterium]|nr:SUMF1/EgtB/PvdO family nonheme iron enzyme [Solirubrobacteraceae bacterium]